MDAPSVPGAAAHKLIFDTTAERFAADVLERSKSTPVAVDFWAPWCGPCRALAPLLEQLVHHYGGRLMVARVNIDDEPAIATQFGIRSIPDVRLFKDGRIVDGFVGVQPLARLQALFEKHVPRASESQRAKALELMRAGDNEGAVSLLRATLQSDPAHGAARIDLAEALARLGNIDDAQRTLDELPVNEATNPAVDPVRARLHFLRHAPAPEELDAVRRAASGGEAALGQMHRLAAHEILRGDPQLAMELLLQVMQRDRKFEDDLGRRSLLQAFALLGEDDERVKHYRRRMAGLLH